MLTPDEFAARAVGVPWARWRSDWLACDCFGLIVLYHREVMGSDLGAVPQTSIEAGFSQSEGWHECGQDAGATCFMAWRDGAPTHCGVLLPGGRVLHSEGSAEKPGSVRVTRIEVMRKIYGELRFYRREPC